MCIVIYSPKDKLVPDCEILKRCFNSNPDGAGYMYVENGKVHIKKGYMNFGDFYGDITKDQYELIHQHIYSPFVIHFRISTHGGTNKSNTHPFPISANEDDLTKTEINCDVGLAHNGILSVASKYSDKMSDTQMFISKFLSHLIKTNSHYYEDEDTMLMIRSLIGNYNKLAILSNDGHCELFGDFIEDDGYYYSNSTYEKDESLFGLYSNGKSGSLYYDFWEKYYSKVQEGYDFDDTYCPFIIDNCSYYCECCLYKDKCKFRN